MGGGGEGPVEDDVEGEAQAAQGVEPPHVRVVADDGEDDGEDVEDDVGHGVLRQRLHGGVLDEAAPEPAAEFDEHGGGHDDDGREAQLDDGVIARGQTVEAFERDLEKGRYHYDGEDEDADRFEFPATDRVGVLVLSRDEFGGGPDDACRQEIEGGVDEGRENGEGGGKDDDGDLPGEEDGVGDEIYIDGYSDNGASAIGFFFVGELDVVSCGPIGGAVAEKRGVFVWELVKSFRGPLHADLGTVAVLGRLVDCLYGRIGFFRGG